MKTTSGLMAFRRVRDPLVSTTTRDLWARPTLKDHDFQIYPGMHADEMHAPYDNHHKVTKTHSNVKSVK